MEGLIGNTPLVRLENIEKKFALKAKLYAKLESFNPTGSIKDRTAKGILDDAEKRGVLQKGGTVIEPTSGNTGIALALLCSLRGYKAIIVMPDSMSMERRQLMKAYGATLVLTDGKLGMTGAIEKAKDLQKELGGFIPDQFNNPANALAHLKTGEELYEDLNGEISAFVAGVGTGGTFTGVARYLKEQASSVYAVAVEPKTSAVLSGGKAGSHGLQGIGAGFIPSVLDESLIDEIFPVADETAYEFAREVNKTEGISAGISAGAALAVAVDVARRAEFEGKNVAVIFPDSGSKYLSSGLYED